MSNQKPFHVRRAAVLGAGVMGSQIAAHLINAGIDTTLYDMPSKEGDPNQLINRALAHLPRMRPAPLTSATNTAFLHSANYEQHLELLKSCDLIIEAVAEKMDVKQTLYKKITPYIKEGAVLATNTSGLSIEQLAQSLPPQLRSHFVGMHFFNPPRYMRLVEIIASPTTDVALMADLESFLVSSLGKDVVRAKDTPNFIANRVGVFALLASMHHATQLKIPLDVVDALTGPILGRPKSATFRLVDIVGLDVLNQVIATLAKNLPEDPWVQYYHVPDWINTLIAKGALGQKAQAGIYKKEGQAIQVLDIITGKYKPLAAIIDPIIQTILNHKEPVKVLQELRNSKIPQAQFLWASFRDLFHYCAVHLATIADTVRDVDLAIHWGFGWQHGPFSIWQAAGWQQVADWINEDIAAGKTMANTPLPDWAIAKERQGVYTEAGAFDSTAKVYKARTQMAVYQRQLFREPVLGETYHEGTTLFENVGLRFWHMGDAIGIVSFKTRMNTIDAAVIDGMFESIAIAERELKGLILWQQQGDDFSVGANLGMLMQAAKTGMDKAEAIITRFQQLVLALRYAMVPTVAALRGRVLGGACELAMHASRIVAAMETRMGLVEMHVGLLPAGCGTKEFALRAAQEAKGDDVFQDLQHYFRQIALAEISGSAQEAKEHNYLRASDVIVMHPQEILYVAKQQIQAMAESNYRPPLQPRFKVAGRTAMASLQAQLVNLREGQFISEYDYEIGTKIAEVLCGGDVEAGSVVTEQWLMANGKKAFIELLAHEKTQARIKHVLETGSPLRN